MANEVQVVFSQQLMDKVISIENALPKNFNKERFVQNSLAFMNDHPELAKINRAQVIGGLMKGAVLGLDYMQKECYLIPYGNSINFQTSYIGEIKFVKLYSIRKIKDIYSKVVRKGDEFIERIIDGKPSIDFKPVPFNGEEIIGAFAVVLYEDEGMEYEAMSVADINAVRNNYSKMANGGSWKKSFDEMCRKTVLRRLCKHIETSFESAEAIKAWEEGSGMDFNNSNKPISEESVPNPFSEEEAVEMEYEEIVEEGTVPPPNFG